MTPGASVSVAYPQPLTPSHDLLSAVEYVIAALLGASVAPPAAPPDTITHPMPIPAGGSILPAIDSGTSDSRVRLAMRLGALLEGGSFSGPWNPGDNGTSFGPFQIHLPAHPGVTEADAEDPNYAVNYMLPEYVSAVAAVDPELWQTDPKTAAATAVFYAERPAAFYPSSRVNAAWSTLLG